jgi:hypothetical protein
MSSEVSELAFEAAIECALLRHGPDACADDPMTVRESGMNSAGQDRVIGERQTAAEFEKPEYRFHASPNITRLYDRMADTATVDEIVGVLQQVSPHSGRSART